MEDAKGISFCEEVGDLKQAAHFLSLLHYCWRDFSPENQTAAQMDFI